MRSRRRTVVTFLAGCTSSPDEERSASPAEERSEDKTQDSALREQEECSDSHSDLREEPNANTSGTSKCAAEVVASEAIVLAVEPVGTASGCQSDRPVQREEKEEGREKGEVSETAEQQTTGQKAAGQTVVSEGTLEADSALMAADQTTRQNKTSYSRGKERGGRSSPAGPVVRLRRLLFRPRFLFLLACGLTAVVQGPEWIRRLTDPAQHPEYQFEMSRIEINPGPRDVPPDLVQQVLRRSQLPDRVSVLDEDLTRRVARAFAAHPWVEEVVSVRKSFPPRLVVELKYRTPVAMVEVPDGLYPVDGQGVLLPPEDFSLADLRRYPVIRGVQTLPQGPAGTAWGDVVVEGAARLAAVLKEEWDRLELAAILVPARTSARDALNRLTFVLLARGGSRIVWGRAPGVRHPGELTPEQKIGRLKKYLSDFGHFDQPHGPYEIDIRHWQEITRRPLTAARYRYVTPR